VDEFFGESIHWTESLLPIAETVGLHQIISRCDFLPMAYFDQKGDERDRFSQNNRWFQTNICEKHQICSESQESALWKVCSKDDLQ
jgi:hypothetical protein